MLFVAYLFELLICLFGCSSGNWQVVITAAQSGVAVFRIVKMHRGEWKDSATFKVVIGHLSPTCTPREVNEDATSSAKDENTAAAGKPQAAEAETANAPRAIGKPPAGAAQTEKSPVRARKKMPPVPLLSSLAALSVPSPVATPSPRVAVTTPRLGKHMDKSGALASATIRDTNGKSVSPRRKLNESGKLMTGREYSQMYGKWMEGDGEEPEAKKEQKHRNVAQKQDAPAQQCANQGNSPNLQAQLQAQLAKTEPTKSPSRSKHVYKPKNTLNKVEGTSAFAKFYNRQVDMQVRACLSVSQYSSLNTAP